MSRRRVLASAVLLLSSAGLATATAAPKLPACPTFADAKGDVVLPDDSLDITKVTYAADTGNFVVKITVAKLAENVTAAPGDRFQATFKAGEKLVEIYYKRSRTRAEEANVFYQQGLRVDGVFINDGVKATHDLKTNTVTMTVKLSALRSAAGKSSVSAGVTEMTATAFGSFVATNEAYDEAAGKPTQKFKVAPCKG